MQVRWNKSSWEGFVLERGYLKADQRVRAGIYMCVKCRQWL